MILSIVRKTKSKGKILTTDKTMYLSTTKKYYSSSHPNDHHSHH